MKAPPGVGQRKIVYLALDAKNARRAQPLMRDYTDLIENDGSAGAWLDVTYNKADIPFGHRVARMLQADLQRDLDLRVAAGVGPNKFVARLAAQSARRGPDSDGLVAVTAPDAAAFVQPLPIDALPGLGRVLRGRLQDLGIETLGELASRPRQALLDMAGKRGIRLWEHAQGIDADPVTPEHAPEHLAAERAFDAPLYNADEIRLEARHLAEELGGRLRRQRLGGRILTLEAHYPDRRSSTRWQVLALPTDANNEILRHTIELLRRTAAAERGLRALKLSIAGFGEEEVNQLSLFGTD